MKLAALLLCTTSLACSASPPAAGVSFQGVRLADEGRALAIVLANGHSIAATKVDDQDGFDKPALSNNHQYAGWLALFPGRGASYSQPLHLTVLDAAGHTRLFSGDFGMVYRWCFTPDSQAVVYRYQFPHGITPIGFDMRRLADGRKLKSFQLAPIGPAADEAQVMRAKAPAWTRCAP